MKILGLRIGRYRSGRKRRKKAPTKLEKLCNARLLHAALKSPGVLAAVIDKFGELSAYHEDELEPIIDNIRDKIQKKAVQTVLKHRRRELVIRIDGIIDEVIGAGDSGSQAYRKKPIVDVATGGQTSAPDTIYRRRTRGPGPEQGSKVRTFIEGLEIIAFLGKIASQQMKDGAGDIGERVYVVEQNGQTVEMSEREYLGYLMNHYLQQAKKKTAPPADVHRLPEVTGPYKTIEGPPGENEERATGIESQ